MTDLALDFKHRNFVYLDLDSKYFDTVPIHIRFQLSEIANTIQTHQTFRSNAQDNAVLSTAQNSALFQFGLILHKWTLLQPHCRNYQHEQWINRWNDSTYGIRWRRTHSFFSSPEISKRNRLKRAALDSGGAAVGGIALSSSLSFSPNPSTAAAAIGAVVGAAGGLIAGDIMWSYGVTKTDEYKMWKENRARLELHDLIRKDSRTQVIINSRRCCISQQQINPRLDMNVEYCDWLEDRTGRLYHLPAITSPSVSYEHSFGVKVRHSINGSQIIDKKENGKLSEGEDVVLQPTDRMIDLAQVSDEDCDVVLHSLTLLPAYRTIYMVLCRMLFVLRQGFPADKVSDEVLATAQQALQTKITTKALEVKLKAIEQILSIINLISNSFKLTFRQAKQIQRTLIEQLNNTDSGDRLVAFVPLLDLPAHFPELLEQKK